MNYAMFSMESVIKYRFLFSLFLLRASTSFHVMDIEMVVEEIHILLSY